MRLTQEAVIKPLHCAVLPQVGAHHQDGYVDTGIDLGGIDPHVYVSVVAVKEMGRLIGLVPPETHAITQARLQAAMEELERLRAQLAEESEFREAVDVIASRDFVTRKKPGRKPTEKREQVAA